MIRSAQFEAAVGLLAVAATFAVLPPLSMNNIFVQKPRRLKLKNNELIAFAEMPSVCTMIINHRCNRSALVHGMDKHIILTLSELYCNILNSYTERAFLQVPVGALRTFLSTWGQKKQAHTSSPYKFDLARQLSFTRKAGNRAVIMSS